MILAGTFFNQDAKRKFCLSDPRVIAWPQIIHHLNYLWL